MRISLKTAGLTATLIGVGAWVVADALEDKSTVRAAPELHPATAPARATSAEPQAEQPGAALPERALAESSAPLFSSHSWQPPPPKVIAKPAPPPAPMAPPVPYRFVGRMLQDGQLSVFLANGDSVITAKQGDTIDGVYRVESVGEHEIALMYLPLKQRQTIAVVSSLPNELSPPFAAAPSGRAPAAVASTPLPAPPRASAPIPAANVIAPAPAPPVGATAPAGPPMQLQSRR
jgi:hypothetical protein